MRKTVRSATSLILFVFLGCSSKTLNVPSGIDLAPIKEYENKLEVKELSGKAAYSPTEDKSVPSSKLGLEPQAKKELKGKKKKKGESMETSSTDTLFQSSAGSRLPEIEDREGFRGRRPIADPYRVGEKVTLMMTYFGVSAGDATLEIRPYVEVNGRKAYHFYSKLTSSSVFSMFYKVDDYCEAFVDYEQMVPFNFILSAKETKQLREVRMYFDWKTKKADYWEQRITAEDGKQEKKKAWDLVDFSQNIYTALQYIRVFELVDGKTYAYHVSDDGKTWDVRATVIRREILKTDLGNYKTIVVKPEVAIGGILKPMGEVYFWFTDDDRKFPIKFEAKIKIGKIVGYLKGIDKGAP